MLDNLRPIFRKLRFYNNASLHIKVESGEKLRNQLHYHPEIELILLKKSKGTRIIGESIGGFTNNDVFLIGKNTPHGFIHEESCLLDDSNNSQAIVVQFFDTFLGKEFFALPELKEIQQLFIVARQGVCLTDKAKARIIPLMENMLNASSLDRILILLQILRRMVIKNSYTTLMPVEPFNCLKIDNEERIKKVVDYTENNFDKNIKIEHVAQIANLTKESFCRYFKSQTGKTYLEFLIEFRISKACKILLENQMSIKEIAYSCGFDSLSNFHYQFKKILKKSPLDFKFSNACSEAFKEEAIPEI